MSGILRLSHADIRMPDIELGLAYYVEVVGLVEVERTAERAYLKGWDEHQHHLIVLSKAPTYGLDLVAESRGKLKRGSVYVTLGRMEQKGLVRSRWGTSESNRRVRVYELTAAARRHLTSTSDAWHRYAKAVARVLSPT